MTDSNGNVLAVRRYNSFSQAFDDGSSTVGVFFSLAAVFFIFMIFAHGL
ncbi:MAG: hypothetical protein M3Y07_12220 [Acidobacteriota bacterium]|nr:hypothetical protein [Acidobacteriota bacterium]